MPNEPFTLELAAADDAPAIAGLRARVADHLTATFGQGHWSTRGTVKGVLRDIAEARVYVSWRAGEPTASLRLATRKPWAIDPSYFTACKRPVYLTNMAVRPDCQRTGIGRQCVRAMIDIAREWPADAIRLDAYDADAGAGDFYARCGFTEVGRKSYRDVPLVYFEMLV